MSPVRTPSSRRTSGAAAALAVLDIVEAPGFLERVTALGERFERELSGLPFTLRRKGLMMGLAMPMAEGGLFAAKALIDKANSNGGPDNITAVLAKVVGVG